MCQIEEYRETLLAAPSISCYDAGKRESWQLCQRSLSRREAPEPPVEPGSFAVFKVRAFQPSLTLLFLPGRITQGAGSIQSLRSPCRCSRTALFHPPNDVPWPSLLHAGTDGSSASVRPGTAAFHGAGAELCSPRHKAGLGVNSTCCARWLFPSVLGVRVSPRQQSRGGSYLGMAQAEQTHQMLLPCLKGPLIKMGTDVLVGADVTGRGAVGLS